jgi:hypothetical protein
MLIKIIENNTKKVGLFIAPNIISPKGWILYKAILVGNRKKKLFLLKNIFKNFTTFFSLRKGEIYIFGLDPQCNGSEQISRHLFRCANPRLLSVQKWALTQPCCALPRYPLLLCRNPSRLSLFFPVAHFLVFNVVQKASWTTFILCKWARVPVWLDAYLDIATKKAMLSTVEGRGSRRLKKRLKISCTTPATVKTNRIRSRKIYIVLIIVFFKKKQFLEINYL